MDSSKLEKCESLSKKYRIWSLLPYFVEIFSEVVGDVLITVVVIRVIVFVLKLGQNIKHVIQNHNDGQ